MRILVDNGTYDLRNKGDVAMLQVAAARLSNLWPSASIEVITRAPYLLKLYCPNARPVGPYGDYDLSKTRNLLRDFQRLVPSSIFRLMFELRGEVWHRWPSLVQFLRVEPKTQSQGRGRLKRKCPESDTRDKEKGSEDKPLFLTMVRAADLVVASGGGYITDAFKKHSIQVLTRLEAAIQLGKPTALFGQGLGPIHDPDLLARAAAVLPSVDLITLREKRAGLPLLESLGVAPVRFITTGDDAIELAYEARAMRLGTAIGVNLRIASYSGVGRNHVKVVRAALHHAAAKYATQLVALPISQYAHESDAEIIRQLLAGHDRVLNGWQRFDTPRKIIKNVGRCRIVVAGSYHASVFALAQGIPVVGLAKSEYYVDKFLGLADLFGTGCEVVLLNDEQLEKKLTAAIDAAWRSAEQVRSRLLEAAKRQVDWGRAAYRQLYERVRLSMDRTPG
jgi:polysaccharide pyruvyl transferase WcaK-like protein